MKKAKTYQYELKDTNNPFARFMTQQRKNELFFVYDEETLKIKFKNILFNGNSNDRIGLVTQVTLILNDFVRLLNVNLYYFQWIVRNIIYDDEKKIKTYIRKKDDIIFVLTWYNDSLKEFHKSSPEYLDYIKTSMEDFLWDNAKMFASKRDAD